MLKETQFPHTYCERLSTITTFIPQVGLKQTLTARAPQPIPQKTSGLPPILCLIFQASPKIPRQSCCLLPSIQLQHSRTPSSELQFSVLALKGNLQKVQMVLRNSKLNIEASTMKIAETPSTISGRSELSWHFRTP